MNETPERNVFVVNIQPKSSLRQATKWVSVDITAAASVGMEFEVDKKQHPPLFSFQDAASFVGLTHLMRFMPKRRRKNVRNGVRSSQAPYKYVFL